MIKLDNSYMGIPDERLIELNEAGDDYKICDPTAEECADGWSVIRWILSGANSKYTRDDILANWPDHRAKPSTSALWKWLENAVPNNFLRRNVPGRNYHPFFYWLPEREKHFGPELEPKMELGPMGVRSLYRVPRSDATLLMGDGR